MTHVVTSAAVLQGNGDLWQTPVGSNDDWYWLYGTVAAGREGMLISNDLMRDHIFELLRPRYFLKWRAHHQHCYRVCCPDASTAASVLPYRSSSDSVRPDSRLEIVPPPRFSTCVQQVPESGAWMVPLAGGRWLCARPTSGTAASLAHGADATAGAGAGDRWGCAAEAPGGDYVWAGVGGIR